MIISVSLMKFTTRIFESEDGRKFGTLEYEEVETIARTHRSQILGYLPHSSLCHQERRHGSTATDISLSR